MVPKPLLRGFTLAALIPLALFVQMGCGGGGEAQSTTLSTEQQTAINNARSRVNTAIAGESAFDTLAGRQRVATAIANDPALESVDVSPIGNLSVKYKGGGVEAWFRNPAYVPPPDLGPQSFYKPSTRAPIGVAKAIVIDAVADDPGWNHDRSPLQRIGQWLARRSITTRFVRGSEINRDLMGNLDQYGVVIYNGHGGVLTANDDSKQFAMITNEEFPASSVGPDGQIRDDSPYLADWRAGRIVKGHVDWGAGADRRNGRIFIAVTKKFFANAYRNHRWNHTLFINGSCESFDDDDYVRTMTHDLGVEGYTGFHGETTFAEAASGAIISRMTQGKDLRSAYDDLPGEYRSRDGATLEWGGEGTVTLSATVSLTSHLEITSPQDGGTTDHRVITLTGLVHDHETSDQLSVEVNKVLLPKVEIAADGSFSSTTVLTSGDNNVIFRLDTSDGREVHSLHINGEFASQDLWTELRWTTSGNDIDLHLLPDGATPWTIADCYYGNKQTQWGGNLDVDDVDGFGPEHITADHLNRGRYLLFVHYYSTRGITTPTTPSFALVVGGVTRILNCPQQMRNRGDIWNVGYITMPEGLFEPTNEFVVGTQASRSLPPKTKQ